MSEEVAVKIPRLEVVAETESCEKLGVGERHTDSHTGSGTESKLNDHCASTDSTEIDRGSESKRESAATRHFKNFEIIKVLNESVHFKSVFVHGRFKDRPDDDAIVILEKRPFTPEIVRQVLSENTEVDVNMMNDVYQLLELYPERKFSGIKSTVICPATQGHFDKYSSQDLYMVAETPERYDSVVRPFIKTASLDLQWVYNILEKRSEVERVIFDDPHPQTGFVLLPDLKWNGKQLEDLYIQAIVYDRGLHSIRDLRQEHIPLLENIKEKGMEAILNIYGISGQQLRIYFHYPPSFYHLHVHFTHLRYEAPGILVGKAHLLDDVIDNLKIDGDFYRKKTMSYYLKETEALYTEHTKNRATHFPTTNT